MNSPIWEKITSGNKMNGQVTEQKRKRGGQMKVSASVIKEVKSMLSNYSQRRVASMTSLSQYTIWCIANNKYEEKIREEPQREREDMFSWDAFRGGIL